MAIKLHSGEVVVEGRHQREWIFNRYILQNDRLRNSLSSDEAHDCLITPVDGKSLYSETHFSDYLFPKYRRCVLIEKTIK